MKSHGRVILKSHGGVFLTADHGGRKPDQGKGLVCEYTIMNVVDGVRGCVQGRHRSYLGPGGSTLASPPLAGAIAHVVIKSTKPENLADPESQGLNEEKVVLELLYYRHLPRFVSVRRSYRPSCLSYWSW